MFDALMLKTPTLKGLVEAVSSVFPSKSPNTLAETSITNGIPSRLLGPKHAIDMKNTLNYSTCFVEERLVFIGI